jgi:hypothetical protein
MVARVSNTGMRTTLVVAALILAVALANSSTRNATPYSMLIVPHPLDTSDSARTWQSA